MPAYAVSVADAARRAHVHASRVRALLRRGGVQGRKVGGRWLTTDAAVDQWLRMRLRDGRPFSPATAWGFLFLLSGEAAPWLAPATRSRLRARARRESLRDLLPKLRLRAQTQHFQAGDSALRAIPSLPGFVASGVSAVNEYGVGLLVRDAVEGYLPAARLREAAYRLALEPVDPVSANVVLRAPALAAPHQHRRVAPPGVVAADLLEWPDLRTRRAGNALAESLRADRSSSR